MVFTIETTFHVVICRVKTKNGIREIKRVWDKTRFKKLFILSKKL